MKLVLLFGMPRSGTTWFGKVFDSHPKTLYLHEPDSVYGLRSIPLFPLIKDIDQYRGSIEEFLLQIVQKGSPRVIGKLPVFRKDYIGNFHYQSRRFKLFISKLFSLLGKELSLKPLYASSGRNNIPVVWKSIESLGRLGLLMQHIKDAKSVHIIRHPCGYVSSVMRGESQGRFGSAIAASEDYGILELLLETEQANEYGLNMDLFNNMHPSERLAWRWVLYNEKAMDDLQACKRNTIVRYEDVCSDPITAFRRVFEFCGLHWDKQSEEFVINSTSNSGSAYYSVYKNPAQVAYSWKNQLKDDDIKRIMSITSQSRAGQLYSS